jgi:anti-sigma factor (TIGR02949 family)
MSCDQTGTVLHGYFDNELDAVGAEAFERHLERCSECVDEVDALKSLRSSMNLAQLYEKAPASFRKRVLADLDLASPVLNAPTGTPWRWLATAAAILMFVYAAWRIVTVQLGGNYETALVAEVVDAHLRSLQPGHLTDVASSDRHTVKPWFDGKLDFSPPVRDFDDQGFPLQGGRLDIVEGQAIAALVYSRRKHVVSVFIWPTREKDGSLRAGSRRGYQWIDWRKDGMEFCAVSDVAPADLQRLQRVFTE